MSKIQGPSFLSRLFGVSSTSAASKSNTSSSAVKAGDGEVANGVKAHKASKLYSTMGAIGRFASMPFVALGAIAAMGIVKLGDVYAKASGRRNPFFRHENKQPVSAFRGQPGGTPQNPQPSAPKARSGVRSTYDLLFRHPSKQPAPVPRGLPNGMPRKPQPSAPEIGVDSVQNPQPSAPPYESDASNDPNKQD